MLRGAHIVLIVGAALVSAGIVISILWAVSFAHQFVLENSIINETLKPHSFVLTTLEVKDIERIVKIIFYYLPSDRINYFVTDPNDMVVKVSYVSHPPSHFEFKPEIAGKYTLHIKNNSSKDVNLNGTFGYVPMTIKNNQTDVNLLNGILVGSSLVVSGMITLMIGIIFVILGKFSRRKPVAP